MRFYEILEAQKHGGYSSDEAKEIGDCAIIAISLVTGLPWDDVFEQAKNSFSKFGLNAGGIGRTVQALGWKTEPYFKMPWWKDTGINVQHGEIWLQKNAPDVRLICLINVRRVPHSIAFVDGKFHNVLGATRAKLSSVDICTPS